MEPSTSARAAAACARACAAVKLCQSPRDGWAHAVRRQAQASTRARGGACKPAPRCRALLVAAGAVAWASPAAASAMSSSSSSSPDASASSSSSSSSSSSLLDCPCTRCACACAAASSSSVRRRVRVSAAASHRAASRRAACAHPTAARAQGWAWPRRAAATPRRKSSRALTPRSAPRPRQARVPLLTELRGVGREWLLFLYVQSVSLLSRACAAAAHERRQHCSRVMRQPAATARCVAFKHGSASAEHCVDAAVAALRGEAHQK
jgi:hypothetical protein